jgi:predicted nicotinamide N-methyase
VPFVGATFAAAVLNPRLLPHRVFNFLIRRRTHQIEIEQGWNPQQRMDGTGACVWDAAITLCDHLCERPQLVEGRRVVELGSGCGVLSIVAARLGARCVHATDLEQALLLLARNVWLNEAAAGQAQGGDAGGGVTVGCCNWGNALHAERVRAQCPGERVDLILGSDLVYRQDRTTFVALLTTLAELSSPDTDILFASKFRMNPEDGVFVATATEMGFAVDIHALPARQNFVGSYQLFHLSKRLQQAKTSLIPSTVTLG